MNSELSNKRFFKTPANIFWIIGFVALCFRLFQNFSQDLIPGVNGGYYPLQVKYVLTNGYLGFSDMPLLFYLDAWLIKTISFLGFTTSDTLIMNVVKVIDSISIPLILVPLYKIIRLSNPIPNKFFNLSIIAFSVLSFSPLILTSDLQKNALAILFLFCFTAFLLSYLLTKKRSDIIFSIIFLLLTGLTHFGTFVFVLFFLSISVLYSYKKKAIIPLITFIAVGIGMIAIFDLSRFNRLLFFWTALFEKPALLNGMLAPPDFLNVFISISLAIVGIIALKQNVNNIFPYQKAMIISSVVCLITFSFPLLDGEYFKRLSLLLFIPQVLIIIQISSLYNYRQLKTISTIIFVITSLSIIAVLGNPKETVIEQSAYEELKNLRSILKSDNETIIIAKHGLEWWTALALGTKVGQDKSINKNFYEKYRNIFFITQINSFSNERQRTPFHEPAVPPNSELIFSSNNFKIFKLNNRQ